MPSYIEHLANTTRSFRRFQANYPVTRELMTQWVNNARITASAGNLQPLRYKIVNDKTTNANVYECLAWANYLKDWKGPEEKERPSGYIVIAADTTIAKPEATHFDAGIAAQTIMLAATEEGFGGCIVLSINKKKLREVLAIPEQLEPVLVLALGRPVEDVRLVEVDKTGSIKYYRDENQVHYVPKRSLEDVLF